MDIITKNIENQPLNHINYYGFVKITTLKNGKVVKAYDYHNSGTSWLFKV